MKSDPNFVRLMSVDVDYKTPPGHKLELWTAGLHCPGCGQLGHFRSGIYFDHEMRCFHGCEPAPKWEPGVEYMKLVRDAKIVTIKPQNMTAEEFKQTADVYLQNVRRVVELCLKLDQTITWYWTSYARPVPGRLCLVELPDQSQGVGRYAGGRRNAWSFGSTSRMCDALENIQPIRWAYFPPALAPARKKSCRAHLTA